MNNQGSPEENDINPYLEMKIDSSFYDEETFISKFKDTNNLLKFECTKPYE